MSAPRKPRKRRETSDRKPIEKATEPSGALTLDDAARILVQLQPDDAELAHELRSILSALANDARLSGNQRALVAEALNMLGARGAHAADEIGRIIERASRDVPAPAEREPTRTAPSAPAPVRFADDVDTALVADFITESREYLQGAEAALLRLEIDPDDIEAVNTVFRAFHTIKGTSAFLALEAITTFAHAAESLLSRMRDREIRCEGAHADLALRSVDVLKELLVNVERRLANADELHVSAYDSVLSRLVAENTQEAQPGHGADVARAPAAEKSVANAAQVAAPDESRRDAPQKPALVAQATRAAAPEASVRVRTERLDRLVDMIGELVIAHSMIAQDGDIRANGLHELARKVAHAGKIVRELQDLSMGMRMVPLRAPFQKVTRLARDLAHKSGKPIEIVVEGEQTEIDRNLVDILADPLVHMVRNAVDHGIESVDERVQSGKPRAGVLHLSASHAGDSVVVVLRDDGRGLNRERILAKAVAMGLANAEQELSDSDVYNMIFLPGVSTAEKVTDVSGRGVGMDVVRRNVEQIRGRIEIASVPGAGTTFTLRLPLTLAITDGMLVRVGAERYIVPTSSIRLSLRPEADALSTVAGRGELVLLRGDAIPIVRLHRLFDVRGAEEDPRRALLMLVGEGSDRAALLVDELLGQYQVVAKALGSGIGRIPGVSGGAILGDGRVGLVLDVRELLAIARGDTRVALAVA